MIVILLVLIISPFSLVFIKSQKLIDPIGANKTIEKKMISDESQDFQIAATLASVMDESLAEDAFNKANEVNNRNLLSIPVTATYALAKPNVTTGGNAPKGKDIFKKYKVQDGDTLWSIARANDLTTDSIRWANEITDIDNIKPGAEIYLPTTVGVLYTVKGGETIKGIASRYGVSAAMIESYNNIIDEELKPGMKVMVPDGVGPELPKPEPRTQIATNRGSQSDYSSAPSYVPSSSGPNRFPWGYCTWWVANKRYIPWNGNAWQWYGNAIAYGRSVGKTPVPGAVLVTWESPVGHVAYVESVNSDGSFTVSEMNFVGYGRVSSRTISSPGAVSLIGFIY